MAGEAEVDTSRARIQTYVPDYQKEEWRDHADELDMSLSEFVRSMVQAGRRGFTGTEERPLRSESEKPSGRGDPDPNPRGSPVEDRVLQIIDDGECYDWDELLEELTDDVEERLEDALQELQSRDEIRYSGRSGGYVRE